MRTCHRTLLPAMLLLFIALAVLPASAFYNPNAGRWLNRDFIEEEGGINLYALAGSDALNFFDILGMASACDKCNNTCQMEVKCKVKSGPVYSPSGTITAQLKDGLKQAGFTFSAEFEDDIATGSCAGCCEVRQYIKWSGSPPNHEGWNPPRTYQADTWYEDRDSENMRYGHRDGGHSDPSEGDGYFDENDEGDVKCGRRYFGRDTPGGAPSRTGWWKFQLKVIDRCDKDKVVATSTELTVDFGR